MDCNEAAEFVSALYDGETVPRTAAEHIGACEVCKARWTSYMEIGIELRRVASLEIPEAAQQRLWGKPQWNLKLWWQKGWETMRIPRIAFAVMSAGIVVLASSLAVVGVRAHSDGTAVMLKVKLAPGQAPFPCPLSTTDKKNDTCSGVAGLEDGMLTYKLKVLQKEGNRVQLGFRSKLDPKPGSGSYSLSTVDDLPESQYWFEPGETLKVDLPNHEKMSVTGEWMDHVPYGIAAENESLDPAPDELRISSPVLLRGEKVVGDFEGGNAIANQPGKVVTLFMPGEGRFQFSLTPIPDAILGHVLWNRVSFESDGRSYVFLTGTPISRSEKIWVRYEPKFKPAEELSKGPYISIERMNPSNTTAPGTK
jgi:hypothetical protein